MIVRLLIWLIVGFLVYTVFQAVKQALQKPDDDQTPEKSGRGEEMIQDPQCGTYVPRSDAVSEKVGGKRRFFCSEACRDAYRSNKH